MTCLAVQQAAFSIPVQDRLGSTTKYYFQLPPRCVLSSPPFSTPLWSLSEEEDATYPEPLPLPRLPELPLLEPELPDDDPLDDEPDEPPPLPPPPPPPFRFHRRSLTPAKTPLSRCSNVAAASRTAISTSLAGCGCDNAGVESTSNATVNVSTENLIVSVRRRLLIYDFNDLGLRYFNEEQKVRWHKESFVVSMWVDDSQSCGASQGVKC
jgi:hypothetical protein